VHTDRVQPAKRILVVDDEQSIVDIVVYALETEGFRTDAALDGEAGLRLFEAQEPSLVVLDLNLPKLPGKELFKTMREIRPRVPVIMLTSSNDEVDRVLGLELGADDYVTKPFSPRELAARAKAVLRRTEGPASPEPASMLHGPLSLNEERFEFKYFGEKVQLTRPEFGLMRELLMSPARLFTREMLIDRIYDESHPVTDRTVDAYVKRLRKKFGTIRPEVDPIETVYGMGYKLRHGLEELA
jgi:two-component system OmpR family response regulator